MCGLAGMFGPQAAEHRVRAMLQAQRHRGPDATGVYCDAGSGAVLGHNRLSIIDLSAAGHQPMASHDGRLQIVFNGEIYNYLELKAELADYPYRSHSDTEVLLAAWQTWGEACLDRLNGMFAFLLWDVGRRRLHAVRDRFGVKPLVYHAHPDGSLIVASEIGTLFAAGVDARADDATWAGYLAHGTYGDADRTFWQGIQQVPAGHALTWEGGQTTVRRWYDLAAASGAEFDTRSDDDVAEEYLSLMRNAVDLRFRSDVPVGINVSGGLDSSTLLGLVQAVQGRDSEVKAFTFVTGHPEYDEWPWVQQMLAHTRHPSVVCRLTASDVPALAESVHVYQAEPYGGLPTLAYARLFERAREEGVIVLLDGQGMDEQWAGYDYYQQAATGRAPLVQGATDRAVRPECLTPDFLARAVPMVERRPFADPLRNLQHRDACVTKLPRALRFNDRVSMRASTELREPFLDYRLFELALRQPAHRKIHGGVGKWLLRRITADLLPGGVVEAPKRALQTPQREWLRGPLREWATERIEQALLTRGGQWLEPKAVREAWRRYCAGAGDNSFWVWQWISAGM